MPAVTIDHNGVQTQVEIPVGATLMDAFRAGGVEVSFPCGGNHTCGKCRVWVRGSLEPAGERERKLLGEGSGQRLACFARVLGDCRVRTVPAGADRIAADFRADPMPPAPIYSGGCGVAVDIGTTTVVGYLFPEDGSTPVAVHGELNRQRAFGADVLSRIAYCNEHTVAPLRDLIRGQLDELMLHLCSRAGCLPDAVKGLCVTGNTTMLHLLAGLEPRTLAMAPFTPQSLFGGTYQLDFPHFPGLTAYLPRCISSYVGADITCSILSSGIASMEETVLLVDIGTNGEMVLSTPGGMICTSTAAGPAFEGAGISAGMSAQSGAISAVWVEDGGVRWRAIDGVEPVGLCGSGLVDGIAALLEVGAILPSGRMDAKLGGRALLGDSGIAITQGDVRQFQLAKGAIRGGMDTLLLRCGLTYENLDRIFLCGGFGSYMNVSSAQKIGLIPPGMAERTTALGNAAGVGAGYILQNVHRQAEAEKIAAAADTVELSTDEYFKRRYVEVMRF